MSIKEKLKKSDRFMNLYAKLLPFYCRMFPVASGKMLYKQTFQKKLDLDNPKDLNEKINWLKLYLYRKDDTVAQCADKYRVRAYLEEKGYGFLLNDLIAVYHSPDEINWEELPERFALKFSSAAGMNFICEDKSKYDKAQVLEKIRGWYRNNRGASTAELHYRNTKPVIICERYICSEHLLPYDYKVYCFNGKAYTTMVCKERETHTKFLFVDAQYNRMYIDTPNFPDSELPPKPDGYADMIRYAEALSKDFPMVRVDFYEENGRVLFGEMTFTPFGGYITCMTQEALDAAGAVLVLPEK